MASLLVRRLLWAPWLVLVIMFWTVFTLAEGIALSTLIIELSVKSTSPVSLDYTWLLWVAPAVGIFAGTLWARNPQNRLRP